MKMKHKFTITGIDCPNCAAKLADIIAAKEGVDSAKINFLTERLTVESALSESEVLKIASDAARAFSRDITVE